MEALLRESLCSPVDCRRAEALLDFYRQYYDTLSDCLKDIVGDIEVRGE